MEDYNLDLDTCLVNAVFRVIVSHRVVDDTRDDLSISSRHDDSG